MSLFQRFRVHKKNSTQTFVEFAREKGILFDKWCTASKVTDFDSLRELVLLEEFKNCLPERVVVYLNEQKVTLLSHAAVLADKFVLTHKNVFAPARSEKTQSAPPQSQAGRSKSSPSHAHKLKLSDDTSCGSSVIVQGIEMDCIKAPLHRIHLESDLCKGFVRVAVRPSLPVKGVDFILGNDLAGGKSRNAGDVVDLSDSFFSPLFAAEEAVDTVVSSKKQPVENLESPSVTVSEADMLKIPVSRERVLAAQKEDTSLVTLFNSAVSSDSVKDMKCAYFVDSNLLMRKWCPKTDTDFEATRFPEAIPLRKITAPVIIKALVLQSLAISHHVSSPYHPESQGSLERFHQTLKSMLRKYCLETAWDWDEGVPLVLFAVRETMQESLGFSPAELVFGHQVRGPLKVLKEHMLSIESSPKTNILDYVSTFREHLHSACTLAKDSLASAQKGMKRKYDQKAVVCSFMPAVELEPSFEILAADEDDVVLRNAPQQCASDVPKQTNVLQHDINVGHAHPVKQHAYRLNAAKRSIMRQEVNYLLENGLAKPSSSPWSSPCLLVPKPDGTFRFCTDYRKVNAVTVPDSYPLPRMEDCVDNVGSAHFVSKLDMLKGYWQVPLTSRASEISAFVTPDTFLQYTSMAFGLRNAPATFQRLVNIVLADVPNCSAHLDDLVIYTMSWQEHLSSLRLVFERLSNASLTLNLAKCEFGKATVTYLGKEVGQGQVRPVEAKVTAILEFPVPITRRELRRFLVLAAPVFTSNFKLEIDASAVARG
ncbi:Retrovirus-related Pol polyprotein [Labeo rohita]|uniref:ribonuclease H n=1 Tax=Labeo rohita TaxID=84645 RepID=A0ABQ8LFW6_LABRO|nr:Retrovirus-related Pol polyprotein [Labeo rohita]